MTSMDEPNPLPESTPVTRAGVAWKEQLESWAIPQYILDQAVVPPWAHDPATFAVDDSIDPRSPIHELARDMLPVAGGSILDVGCGGGRSSIPLVPRASSIIAIDESAGMLARFAQAAEEVGVAHKEIQGRFPDVVRAAESSGRPVQPCDVVVCHHVLFNVADLEPFIVSLTAMARLGVVVVIPRNHPLSAWNAAWKHFWNLDRPNGPTSDDAVDVIRALGFDPEVVVVPRPPLPRQADDPKTLAAVARRRLCLPQDKEEDVELWLAEHPPEFMREVVVLRWPGGL
jgi:SAM-dependent methyltransferase